MMGYGNSWDVSQWFVMVTMMMLFWAVVIGVVVWSLGRRSTTDQAPVVKDREKVPSL